MGVEDPSCQTCCSEVVKDFESVSRVSRVDQLMATRSRHGVVHTRISSTAVAPKP